MTQIKNIFKVKKDTTENKAFVLQKANQVNSSAMRYGLPPHPESLGVTLIIEPEVSSEYCQLRPKNQ